MGRLEKLLLVLVGALILFVGVQVVRAPGHAQPPQPVAQQGAEDDPEPDETPVTRVLVAPSRTPRLNDLVVSARSSQEPPPMRDLAEIRSKLLAGENGTYIGDMLAAQDSVLARWPERRVNGIRVWVEDGRSIPDWSRSFADMARSVFDEWQFTGSPLRFEFVLDTVSSDIRVHWIHNFASSQIGSATRLVDQSNWIVGADITIAVHDSVGRAFSPIEITGIVRHEVGHALGLGHSTDRRTLMFPEETMFDISPADQLTLKLLYSIPPGAVNK